MWLEEGMALEGTIILQSHRRHGKTGTWDVYAEIPLEQCWALVRDLPKIDHWQKWRLESVFEKQFRGEKSI